jgi:hypothetical protein
MCVFSCPHHDLHLIKTWNNACSHRKTEEPEEDSVPLVPLKQTEGEPEAAAVTPLPRAADTAATNPALMFFMCFMGPSALVWLSS